MRLNLSAFVFTALSFFATELFSQKNIDWNPNKLGTSQATCAPVNQNSPNPKGPGNDQINNGNGTIATSYTATACGLNYTMAKVRLGKRFFPAGVNQPAAITITGIPVCRQILRAYLYTGGSGNGINFSATVTNPAATASVFPMTQIGNHIDKCWGYTGTYNYRADITALITGNGNYMVSGIPTSITTPGNDMDGASILIIYADPTQNFTGHIVIADGCQVGVGGTQTNTITGFNACAASTMANAFMFITDLQNINPTDVAFNAPANNFVYPAASNDWYDHMVMAAAPAVNAGQTTCRYSVTNNGDCYNIMVEGLYYRTNCNVCSNNLTVTPVVTSTCTAGSATAIVTGGTAPYSYTWTPTALNTSVITNVPTGNYTVTVRDASGCLTGSATVLIPANATTLAVNSGTICTGNSITLSAIGGGTYTWTPSATLSSANGPNVVATPAATTIYTVTGTNSLGCSGTAVSTVVVNPLPVIAVNNPTACLNTNLALTANGGTAYAWVGPNGFNSALQNPIITNAQLNQSGNYTVTVTSAQGCTNTAVSNASVLPLPTLTVTGTNTFCSQNFNGSINTTNLTSSGANSYSWTLPAGFSGAPNLNSSPITLTGPVTANQTVATLTVVGAIGACTNSAVYTVTVIPNPTIVPAPATASICQGFSTNLSVSGASTYTWAPGTGLNTTNGPNVIANPNVTTVYSIIGTSVGCNSQTQNVTLNVVPNPTVTVNPPTPAICLGNNIALTASGATNYTWTPNIALSTTLGANVNSNPTTTQTYSVLGSTAGCTNVAVVTVSVLGLPSVTVTPSSPTICMNNFNNSPNTVTLNANGANTYTWGPIVGLTTNTLNGSSVIGTSNGNAIGTGTVIGANGTCTNMATFTVNAILNPVIAVTSGSMCAGTSVNLNASGANTYSWSPAATLNTANGANVTASPSVTTMYSVIGSSVGCNSQTQNGTASVVANPTVIVNPPTPAICLGNNIALTASGATNYTWTPNIALNTIVGANVTSNPTATQTYSVLGSQAGCTNVAVVTVSVLGLPSVTVTPSSPTLCMNNFNNSPNTVTLNASGANTYTWGPIVGLTTNTLNGSSVIGTSNGNAVATGTVIGANGTCTNMATFTVNAIPNPVIAVTSGSMCAGTSVNLSASGANTYAWSPSTALNMATGPNVIASPSVTTVYSVIGSSVGCNSQTQNAIATVVANPTVVITPPNPVICLGDNINLTASGANNYTWSPNVAISTLNGPNVNVNPTANQTYTIIGEQTTCTNVAVVTVTVLPLPVVSVAPSSNTLCMNNFNGSPNTVVLNASGATTFTWGPIVGLTTNTLNGSSIIGTSNGNAIGTGTVIGANGTCTNIATFTVNAIPNPIIAVTSGSMCAGTNINLSASGANTYTWSPAATLNTANGANVTANPAVTTVYSVIGSSVGCNSQTQNGTANVVANPTPVISPPTPTICFGTSIGLTASGATNYTWSPNISISNLIGSNVTVNPTSTLEYTVIGEQATCTNTAVRTVTVINLPIVNISTSSPSLCMNNFNGSPNTINITAMGATSYTWLGFNGLNANTTSGPNVLGTAIPPSIIGTGTVIGSASTCTNIATFSVAIIPNPNISIPTATVCFGKSVMLTASGADSYNWSPAGSLSSPNGATVFASPTNTTVYSVIGTSLNCNSTTQTTTVDVVPNPTVLITPGNPTICAGSSIGLAAFGAASYTWFPSASLDNPLASNVIASPNVTTLYTVIGMLNSCTSTAVQQVTVVPLPNLQAIADRTVLCSGDIANINANGASSYTWVPNVNISDANSNFIVASPAATTIYSLIGTNGICTATLEVPIHVVAKPVLNLIANPSKVCYGNSSNIFATGAQNYSWSPVQTLNMVSPNVAVVSPSVNTNYTITGINSNGTVSCVMTQEILVEVVAPINAAISNSSTICQGETIRLTSGGSNSYQWTPEDGLSNPHISSPYANPASTTIYTVFISDGGFCKVTATVLVNVNPVPRVDAGPDMIYNIDEPMYLNAKGTGTISWISGDGVLCKDCPYTQIMPNNTGCYKIQAINEFGCKAIDEVCIEVTKNHSIYIPNIFTPNEDGLNETFLVYGVGISEISVTIFDRWGERLYFAEEQTTGWNGYYNDVLCKNDVYVYLVTYKALDGKKYTKTGHVTLLK